MMPTSPNTESYNNTTSGQALKDFQLEKDIKKKLDWGYGQKISNYIDQTTSGVVSYFWLRNQRFGLNRRWANGRIDVRAMFQDRLDMTGKLNYVNLSWKTALLVNTLMSKEVSR